MNYQHLWSAQPQAYGAGSLGRHMQRLELLSQPAADVSPAIDSHSDAHKIAVSQEAKSNPVLALRLIKQGKPISANPAEAPVQRSSPQPIHSADNGKKLSWLGVSRYRRSKHGGLSVQHAE